MSTLNFIPQVLHYKQQLMQLHMCQNVSTIAKCCMQCKALLSTMWTEISCFHIFMFPPPVINSFQSSKTFQSNMTKSRQFFLSSPNWCLHNAILLRLQIPVNEMFTLNCSPVYTICSLAVSGVLPLKDNVGSGALWFIIKLLLSVLGIARSKWNF